MRTLLLCSLSLTLLACKPAAPPPAETDKSAVPSVPAAAETEGTSEDGANDPRVWLHPEDAAQSLIIAAAGTGGAEIYDLQGKRVQVVDKVTANFVDVRYGFDLGGKPTTLLLIHDSATASILPFTIDASSRAVSRLPGKAIPVATEVTGLCTSRSPITGKVYAYVITDDGLLQQWALFANSGGFDSSLVRTVPLGKGAGFCTTDDVSDSLYFADETLGVFRLPADPEAETERKPIDLVKPYGNLDAEPKGLALVRDASGSGTARNRRLWRRAVPPVRSGR